VVYIQYSVNCSTNQLTPTCSSTHHTFQKTAHRWRTTVERNFFILWWLVSEWGTMEGVRRAFYVVGQMIRETGQSMDHLGIRVQGGYHYREPCKF